MASRPSSSSAPSSNSRGPRFSELPSGSERSPAPEESYTVLPPGPDSPAFRPKMDPLPSSAVPEHFLRLPKIEDLLETPTSREQTRVAELCMRYLSDPLNPLPSLNREAHIEFLEYALGPDEDGEQLPSHFVTLDAARPWILYWALMGLHCLGEDVSVYRARVISTLRPLQNPTGGFGGGYMQMSHVAPSYAAVLSLVIVGGQEALDVIDRMNMWRWLSEMKQPDGGFSMSVGGEIDVRATYCALTIIALLQLPLDTPDGKVGGLIENTAEWIGKCQTYEGGLGGAPGTEAHGGYVFCGLAGLCILGNPWEILPKHLNIPLLVSWITARQYAPEGGFSGRTNKLVDGCYSAWVGETFALIEAALNSPPNGNKAPEVVDVESIWSREGLARYIMCCCQGSHGGLRDKPGKNPDFYHSCYVLQGFAAAQNYYFPTSSTTISPLPPLPYAFHWSYTSVIPTTTPNESEIVPTTYDPYCIDEEIDADTRGEHWWERLLEKDRAGEHWEVWRSGSRVAPGHPVFNVPFERVTEVGKYFAEKGL